MSITQHHILALTCNWHPDTAHMPRQPKLVLIIIQFSNWWPHSQTIAHSGTAVTVVSQIILVATLFQEIPSLLSHCVSILIYIFHVSMHSIWINCIRHISFVSSGECLNQALPLLPFPGGRDTSPDTARCFTVFIEELHLESCVIFIFQTTICRIKKFSRPGGDSCHWTLLALRVFIEKLDWRFHD